VAEKINFRIYRTNESLRKRMKEVFKSWGVVKSELQTNTVFSGEPGVGAPCKKKTGEIVGPQTHDHADGRREVPKRVEPTQRTQVHPILNKRSPEKKGGGNTAGKVLPTV